MHYNVHSSTLSMLKTQNRHVDLALTQLMIKDTLWYVDYLKRVPLAFRNIDCHYQLQLRVTMAIVEGQGPCGPLPKYFFLPCAVQT